VIRRENERVRGGLRYGPSAMADDRAQREEDRARAGAWYAVLGFGALVAGAAVILRWIPDNPFSTPSELPNTTRLNADRLTGVHAPMLGVRPSELSAVGSGCRVSDIALVQNRPGALRQTTLQSLEVFAERSRARGRRFRPAGWTARGPDGDAGADAAAGGCVVTFTFEDGRGPHHARWLVAEDRLTVEPANDLAREIAALAPGLRPR
jgi:hypothetical protein